MGKDERTPEQIKADAIAEAELIVEEAKAKASNIVKSGKAPADKRVKQSDYKMENDKYDKYALVRVKASPEAMFHTPEKEYLVHGVQAEMLIRKGEVSFVSVEKIGPGKNVYAVADPKPKK